MDTRPNKIAYMDEVRSTFGEYKRRALDMIDIGPGQKVLDVGCGTGDDLLALANLVGPGGEVVGVDTDEAMVTEARRRIRGLALPISVAVGDTYDLGGPDRRFDAARADRLFQHLHAPERGLAELRRVTKDGGRVLVVDVDWETLAVASSYPDATRAIVSLASDLHANGRAGRHL